MVKNDMRTVAYVFGRELIEQARPYITQNGTVITPTYSVYVQDAHSGVRQLLNNTPSTAAVTDAYTYDAFGTLVLQAHTGGGLPNTHLYRGEVWDAGLGLTYLRARYLDSRTGRFTATDPWEGDLNTPLTFQDYAYAHNDPIGMSDPSGRGAEFAVLTSVLRILGGVAFGLPPVLYSGTRLIVEWDTDRLTQTQDLYVKSIHRMLVAAARERNDQGILDVANAIREAVILKSEAGAIGPPSDSITYRIVGAADSLFAYRIVLSYDFFERGTSTYWDSEIAAGRNVNNCRWASAVDTQIATLLKEGRRITTGDFSINGYEPDTWKYDAFNRIYETRAYQRWRDGINGIPQELFPAY